MPGPGAVGPLCFIPVLSVSVLFAHHRWHLSVYFCTIFPNVIVMRQNVPVRSGRGLSRRAWFNQREHDNAAAAATLYCITSDKS